MARKSWRNHLWIVTCVFFLLALYNIIFAWVGLVFFITPLLIAIFKGDKTYCNKYCDRGRLFRFLGSRLGASRNKPMPAWLKSRWFRYLFMVYFFGMFGSVLAVTVMVASQAQEFNGAIKLFQAFRLPLDINAPIGDFSAWSVQFAFGFYSLMLTSLVLGLVSMLLFKPRSWCVYCPMGTLTQLICTVKSKSCHEAEAKKATGQQA